MCNSGHFLGADWVAGLDEAGTRSRPQDVVASPPIGNANRGCARIHGDGWLHEPKLHGYRPNVGKEGRRGAKRQAVLADALQAIPARSIVWRRVIHSLGSVASFSERETIQPPLSTA